MGNFRRIGALVIAGMLISAAPAAAYDFERKLAPGDEGEDVRELQLRVAGWFPRANKRQLKLTGIYDTKTANAVKAFQRFYELEVTGEADKDDFAKLAELEDDDGSTKHFEWDEFDQNYNSACSKEANRYAGTFKGGPVGNKTVKANVRQLMWRLEALRAKSGHNPIGINSGYRSTAYNECIGGARYSQHLYGAAIDIRIAEVHNHDARVTARGTQFHGIACYSRFTHTHLDTRLDNIDMPAAHYWYWPKKDEKKRELADDGELCHGEKSYYKQQQERANMLRNVRAWEPRTPTVHEIEAFENSVEYYGGLAD